MHREHREPCVPMCGCMRAYLLQGGVRDAIATQAQVIQVGVQSGQQGAVWGGTGWGEGRQWVDQISTLGFLQSRLRNMGLDKRLQVCIVNLFGFCALHLHIEKQKGNQLSQLIYTYLFMRMSKKKRHPTRMVKKKESSVCMKQFAAVSTASLLQAPSPSHRFFFLYTWYSSHCCIMLWR